MQFWVNITDVRIQYKEKIIVGWNSSKKWGKSVSIWILEKLRKY